MLFRVYFKLYVQLILELNCFHIALWPFMLTVGDEDFLQNVNMWNESWLVVGYQDIKYIWCVQSAKDFTHTLNTPIVIYIPITYIKSRFIPHIYILHIFTFIFKNTSKHTISITKNWYRSILLTKYNSRAPRAAALFWIKSPPYALFFSRS